MSAGSSPAREVERGYRHVEYFLAEPALDQAYEHLVAAKEIIDRTVSDARYASPTVTYG